MSSIPGLFQGIRPKVLHVYQVKGIHDTLCPFSPPADKPGIWAFPGSLGRDLRTSRWRDLGGTSGGGRRSSRSLLRGGGPARPCHLASLHGSPAAGGVRRALQSAVRTWRFPPLRLVAAARPRWVSAPARCPRAHRLHAALVRPSAGAPASRGRPSGGRQRLLACPAPLSSSRWVTRYRVGRRFFWLV